MTPLDSIFSGSPSPYFPPWAQGDGRHLPPASVLVQKDVDQGEGQSNVFGLHLRSADSMPGTVPGCENADSWAHLRPAHLRGCAWEGDGGWLGGLWGVPDEGERREREAFGRALLLLPKPGFSRTALWTLACGVSWLLSREHVKKRSLDAHEHTQLPGGAGP